MAAGSDPILPAVLELPEEVEDAFLHALIPNLDSRQVLYLVSTRAIPFHYIFLFSISGYLPLLGFTWSSPSLWFDFT